VASGVSLSPLGDKRGSMKGSQTRQERAPLFMRPESSDSKKEATASRSDGHGKAKTFSVDIMKNPDTLVSEARQVAEENDATFKGDRNSGSFSGNGVEGSYDVEGEDLTVTITDKPTLAPRSTVESRVRAFFQA
jgi:hypothetical protein